MNTGFFKRYLYAQSTRMSLLAAGLAIALPMAACIALAQEPAASTSKMTTPEGYSAHYTVDVSGRVNDTVHSGAMYDTLVNLQSGPRVSGETIELHKLDSNKHAWVDDARATGSGFGGDPYNFAKLSMSKSNLYEFNGIFRRDRQYFDYDLLGNPNIPGGLSLPIGPSTAPTGHLLWQQPQHSSVMTNSVRRMTDTDLTLYPLSKFSVRLAYSQNIMQGPSLLPVRSGGVIKYNALMDLYQRHSTDEYSVAFDWKPVKGTQVTYEQRMHHYKENSYITLDPNGFQVQEAIWATGISRAMGRLRPPLRGRRTALPPAAATASRVPLRSSTHHRTAARRSSIRPARWSPATCGRIPSAPTCRARSCASSRPVSRT